MNHYEVLEVRATSSQSEIKGAYRKLVKRFHPDINPSPAAAGRMILINEAYEVLSNHTTRSLYDQYLKGVPVKTDIQENPRAQRYREEYLTRKARKEREHIIFLVKLKTRFYRYERLANMLFFAMAILMTIDYYFQPNQQVEIVSEISNSRFQTKILTEKNARILTSERFFHEYSDRGRNQILVKYSLFFNIPAKIQVIDSDEDFIVNGSIYTYRNVFSIIILFFSAIVVKNKEYTDFRLSCGLVPCFFILFIILFIITEI
ncbi:MAG: DnaJ domain-containing protein [Ekhidna sp.]